MTDLEVQRNIVAALDLIEQMIQEVSDPDFENHNASACERFRKIVGSLRGDLG